MKPHTPTLELRRSSRTPKPIYKFSHLLYYLLLIDRGGLRCYDESKRYKATQVVKGCQQRKDIDYSELFSPVVKLTTIRVVLNIMVVEDLHLKQLNVKTIFLHGSLEKDIYMQQLQGYKIEDNTKMVCKLKKNLYRLKQAPMQW